MDLEAKVKAMAEGIARAEGFYVAGSLPQRANNPGDLKLGNLGYGEISGKTVFPDPSAGWRALYNQVRKILTNRSTAGYSTDQTFLDVAKLYTGGDNAGPWANTVARNVGLSPGNTVQDYLNV